MGEIVRVKKKKGRPSKADIAARKAAEDTRRRQLRHHRQRMTEDEEEQENRRDRRRSLRRRSSVRYNLIDYDDEDYWEDDEEGLQLLQNDNEEEEDNNNEVDEEEEEPVEDEEDDDERRQKKVKLVVRLPNRKTRSSSGRNARNRAVLNGGGTESWTQRVANSEDEEEQDMEERGDEGEEEDYRAVKKRKIIRGEDYDEDNYEDDEEKERRKDESNRKDSSAPESSNDAPTQTPMPEKKQLELILDKLQKKDTYGVYAEPADPEELPDYHDVIEHPMDFSTIRKKLADGKYCTLEQFESDVYLICSNAMQYNASDTVYHKQARVIKELGEKKFRRVRVHMEQLAKEAKSEQKMKPTPIIIKKQAKKPQCRGIQDPVGSDFSEGATLATGDAPTTTASAGPTSNCERPSNNEGIMEGISSLTDSNNEKAEDLQSGKGQVSKLGRKWFMVDENRRGTYDESNQPVDRSNSVFATFEDEEKLLIPVGLYGEHSYAQSLARFAATLGPAAWSMASEKIEKALPPGFKYGRGWVGEFEPLPTPILYTQSQTRKEYPFDRNLQNPVVSVKGLKTPTTFIASNHCQDNGPISNGNPSLVTNSAGSEPATASNTIVQTPIPFLKKSSSKGLKNSKLIASNNFRPNGSISNGEPSHLTSSAGSEPVTASNIAVQTPIPFLRKLQDAAAPVKSNHSLHLASDKNVKVEPVLNGKPSLLPDCGGSKPTTTALPGAFIPQPNPFVRNLWNGSAHEEGHKPVQTQVTSKERLGNGSVLEGKRSPRPDSKGSRPATPSSGIGKQKNPFSKNNDSGPESMIVKRVELNSPTVTANQNTNESQQKQFHRSAEITTPKQANMSFLQSLPFRPPPPVTVASTGAMPGAGFTDKKKRSMLNVCVDINQPCSSSGASPSQAIGMTKMAFPPRHDQGLSDPGQVMKTFTGNGQKHQNNSSNSLISSVQIRPSIQSPREGGNTSGAAMAAASAWMSMGAVGVKPTTENLNLQTRGEISAESLYQRLQKSQSYGETQLSYVTHFQSENNLFPFQAFVPQPVKPSNEAHIQQQRPMLFPHLMVNDPSRVQHVQSPWRGTSQHNTQQRQKADNLPPDLNIAFQSTVDSQQPDLALQL